MRRCANEVEKNGVRSVLFEESLTTVVNKNQKIMKKISKFIGSIITWEIELTKSIWNFLFRRK